MKMEAISRVQGVKVLVGKGKGSQNAFAGDIFECSEAEGERLSTLGAAQEYTVNDRLAGLTDDAKPAAKKSAAKKPATKKPESPKAVDGSDTATDEDLGL